MARIAHIVMSALFVFVLVGHALVAFADSPATQPATQPAPLIVRLTERAAKEVKAIAAAQAFDRFWFRVGVKPGENAKQLRYVFDIQDIKPDPNADQIFESAGVTIAVDHKSTIYLKGTVIDFRDDDGGRGFIIQNPNAAKE